MVGLLGQKDELLRTVERAFEGTTIHVRGNEITVDGPEAAPRRPSVRGARRPARAGTLVDEANIGRTIEMVKEDRRAPPRCSRPRSAARPRASGCTRRRPARSATSTPSPSNAITFGIGPAGTGKSYLAVALAVQALQAKAGRTASSSPGRPSRPASGSASSPATCMAKVDPYLRPLYDALYDMLEPEGTQRLMERGAIEVAPLAFMRGRTLNSQLRHPRRGAEHDARADEDVPHHASALGPRSSSPVTSPRSTSPAAAPA